MKGKPERCIALTLVLETIEDRDAIGWRGFEMEVICGM